MCTKGADTLNHTRPRTRCTSPAPAPPKPPPPAACTKAGHPRAHGGRKPMPHAPWPHELHARASAHAVAPPGRAGRMGAQAPKQPTPPASTRGHLGPTGRRRGHLGPGTAGERLDGVVNPARLAPQPPPHPRQAGQPPRRSPAGPEGRTKVHEDGTATRCRRCQQPPKRPPARRVRVAGRRAAQREGRLSKVTASARACWQVPRVDAEEHAGQPWALQPARGSPRHAAQGRRPKSQAPTGPAGAQGTAPAPHRGAQSAPLWAMGYGLSGSGHVLPWCGQAVCEVGGLGDRPRVWG